MKMLNLLPDVEIQKTMEERREMVDDTLTVEEVEIERVVKNEPVDGPQPVREEGDTVIVPVVKQVLHIEKTWVLCEEIRLKRRRVQRSVHEQVPVQYERTEIPGGGRRGILGGRVPAFKGKLDR